MTSGERVVVIGSGPAGATAAWFMARAGLQPLVLEAGAACAPLGMTARIRGFTVAKWKPPLTRRTDLALSGDETAEVYEALAPGGLSNHWACAVPRFSREDFDDAARAGEPYTWPIGYEDLVPWYDRVEPLLCIAGQADDSASLPAGKVSAPWALGSEWDGARRAAGELSRSLVAMPYAFGAATTFTPAATAFNAFTRLVRPLERSGALTVRYSAQVLRLEWSEREQRVTGVVARDRTSGAEVRFPCRAVVLAAGAINSAQILLASRSADFPAGLGNQNDVLGRYLHDHPLGKLVVDLEHEVELLPPSYLTRPALEAAEPLYAAACMQWSGAASLLRTFARGRPGRTSRLGFSIFGTMAPAPTDRVSLHELAPSATTLRLALRHPAESIRVLEQTRDQLLDVFRRAGWAPRTHLWKLEVPGNSVHYGGTCRMHAHPRYGVVDSMCRVFDVPNVVVADSAVFTTGPEKNPVLTAMALAARASDSLARELGAPS